MLWSPFSREWFSSKPLQPSHAGGWARHTAPRLADYGDWSANPRHTWWPRTRWANGCCTQYIGRHVQRLPARGGPRRQYSRRTSRACHPAAWRSGKSLIQMTDDECTLLKASATVLAKWERNWSVPNVSPTRLIPLLLVHRSAENISGSRTIALERV